MTLQRTTTAVCRGVSLLLVLYGVSTACRASWAADQLADAATEVANESASAIDAYQHVDMECQVSFGPVDGERTPYFRFRYAADGEKEFCRVDYGELLSEQYGIDAVLYLVHGGKWAVKGSYQGEQTTPTPEVITFAPDVVRELSGMIPAAAKPGFAFKHGYMGSVPTTLTQGGWLTLKERREDDRSVAWQVVGTRETAAEQLKEDPEFLAPNLSEYRYSVELVKPFHLILREVTEHEFADTGSRTQIIAVTYDDPAAEVPRVRSARHTYTFEGREYGHVAEMTRLDFGSPDPKLFLPETYGLDPALFMTPSAGGGFWLIGCVVAVVLTVLGLWLRRRF